jgi:non-heme Fe2+,alpha-ketoglutarate-dependent halogenase
MSHETQDAHALTEEQREFFLREGYIGPFDAYEPEEIDALWKKARPQTFDSTHAVFPRGEGKQDPISSYDRHLDIGLLGQHVCHPKIVHKLKSVLGPDILCWRSEFFPKYPGDEGTDWHQGDTFAGLNGGKDSLVWPEGTARGGTVTVWTAFSDVTMDMGPFGVIPRTQHVMHYDEKKQATYSMEEKTGLVKNGVRRGFYGYDYRDLQIDPDWTPDESHAVYFTMKKGQFVIFWSTLVHGALPHLGQTQTPRLGYVARYVPTKVKVYPGSDSLTEFGRTVSLEKYGTVLVAGKDDYGHNRIRHDTTRGEPFRRA